MSQRRRHILQVSTFPFLAVLLCAMGSLILLLLVIDRRARVVARTKVLQALLRAQEETAEQAAARKAELQRRHQELHDLLHQQDEELHGQLATLQEQQQAASKELQQEQVRNREMRARLAAESARLGQQRTAVGTRKLQLTQAAQNTQASKSELARLGAELEQLERALADIKLVRQRARNMYSVVPYKGKQGDSRRPIYLECAANGLIFHPERLALDDLAAIRTEVERRIDRQRAAEGASAATKDSEKAYLLMLVRPDGIATYYQTVTALSGLKVDFGYEFIEGDWALEFPADDAVQSQPWMTAENRAAPSGAPPRNLTGNAPRGGFEGVAFGAGAPTPRGSGTGTGTSGAGTPGTGTPGWAGRGPSGSAQASAGGPTGRLVPLLPNPYGGVGSGAPLGRPGGPGGDGTGPGGRGQDSRGGGGPGQDGRGSVAGGPGSVPGSPGGASATERASPSDSARVGVGGAQGSPGGASATEKASPSDSARVGVGSAPGSPGGASATEKASPSDRVGPGSPQGAAVTTASAANRQGIKGSSDVVRPPSLLPAVEGGAANSGAARSGTASASSGPGSGAVGGTGEPGEAQDSPLSRLMPPTVKAKGDRPAPVRPAWLYANRDWNIDIECTVDAVLIRGSAQRIPANQLARGADNPLAKAVRQMIDRRQALVPKGEPPYRPMIRLLVRHDALRTYYLAYPALDILQLPMTRENIDE